MKWNVAARRASGAHLGTGRGLAGTAAGDSPRQWPRADRRPVYDLVDYGTVTFFMIGRAGGPGGWSVTDPPFPAETRK